MAELDFRVEIGTIRLPCKVSSFSETIQMSIMSNISLVSVAGLWHTYRKRLFFLFLEEQKSCCFFMRMPQTAVQLCNIILTLRDISLRCSALQGTAWLYPWATGNGAELTLHTVAFSFSSSSHNDYNYLRRKLYSVQRTEVYFCHYMNIVKDACQAAVPSKFRSRLCQSRG